jgi:hypothetical protein
MAWSGLGKIITSLEVATVKKLLHTDYFKHIILK